jgi:hypothetical protein
MTDETAPPSGARTATEFRDIADALRNRIDLFGKTLAAVAALGTTAVGLSEIGDLFPAEGNVEWVVGACIALAVAALAAIGVAVRLMRVGRPIFMSADVDSNEDLDEGERSAVRPVLDAAARRFGYTSLIGLQERERSLRKAASRATDNAERARRTALADEVKAEIEQALARGQVVAIRRRSTSAVSRWTAWLLYVLVIGGLILFAVGTDKVSSDRKDPIADAKACGEARKAGATAGELGRTNEICDGAAQEAEEEPKPPSAAEARAQISTKLAATLEACAMLVQKDSDATSGPLKGEDCDPVRNALSRMDPATQQPASP